MRDWRVARYDVDDKYVIIHFRDTTYYHWLKIAIRGKGYQYSDTSYTETRTHVEYPWNDAINYGIRQLPLKLQKIIYSNAVNRLPSIDKIWDDKLKKYVIELLNKEINSPWDQLIL